MKRRDHSAAVGLCASLVMHAAIVAALLVFYVKDMDARRWWDAPDLQQGRAEAVASREADRMVYRDGEFGETTGAGEALNSLEGLKPFSGRLGPQDQAPLSRDPVGNGKLADEPQTTALKEGVEAKMPQSIAGDPGASAPFGPGKIADMAAPKVLARPPMLAIAIEEKAAEERSQNSEVDNQKAPHPALSPEPKGEGKNEEYASEGRKGDGRGDGDSAESRPTPFSEAAGSNGGAAGDPAPMSESESDAFSRSGSINVRNGKVEARLGRTFKSVKPRLSLKGELDAISIANPIVEMKVSVDETGKVIDVKVLRSSGSNEIDLPTTTAMYKWWIEPAKDKQGKAVKDVILVTFSYL